MRRMIVTNGSVAAARLATFMPNARIVTWDDILHDGPVPGGLELEVLSQRRAAFIADSFGLDAAETLSRFRARDAAIRSHHVYDRIEIWLEHDLYDQLQLIQILSYFQEDGRRNGLYLAQANDHLGALPAQDLRTLAARPIPAAMLDLAAECWTAFTAPTPETIPSAFGAVEHPLPLLAHALQRLLREYPSPRSGLSLTEERILASLQDGPTTAGALFRQVQKAEDAPFLGDLSFFLRLEWLASAGPPLIEGMAGRVRDYGSQGKDFRSLAAVRLRITEHGLAALAGDRPAALPAARWIGGTCLTADACWSFDRESGRLLPPS